MKFLFIASALLLSFSATSYAKKPGAKDARKPASSKCSKLVNAIAAAVGSKENLVDTVADAPIPTYFIQVISADNDIIQYKLTVTERADGRCIVDSLSPAPAN